MKNILNVGLELMQHLWHPLFLKRKFCMAMKTMLDEGQAFGNGGLDCGDVKRGREMVILYGKCITIYNICAIV
jgi:hypothetical protein